jgi:hypothetical protein
VKRLILPLCLVLTLCSPRAALASSFTIDMSVAGQYATDPTPGVFYSSGNLSYLAGDTNAAHKNFFVFNLSGVSGTIAGAQFEVQTYTVTGSGTFSVFQTALDPTTTETSCSDTATCSSTFAALDATTPAIGSVGLTASSSNSVQTLVFNPAGVAWLQANEGKTVVLGGDFPEPLDSFFFAFGRPSDLAFLSTDGVLAITTRDGTAVPEPKTVVLLGLGLALAIVVARARLW